MALSYSLARRETFVQKYNSGQSLIQISREEGVSYRTLISLIQRYKAQGEAGLLTHYHRCGHTRTYESERSYRLVRLYKHLHPTWGIGYILMKIKDKYPDLPLCVSRVYERRLKTDHLVNMPRNPPLASVYYPDKARVPHDTWQIDAKENIVTLDGQAACYLTTTDEKTAGALAAKVFPPQSYKSSTFSGHSSVAF